MDSAIPLNCKNEYQISSECFSLPLSPSVIIFKRSYSASSILWNDVHFLFGEIKKRFFLIKSFTLDKTDLIETENPLKYIQNSRADISKVFQCILNNLQFMSSCSSSDLKPHSKTITGLLKEIKHLLIFIGRINDIPNIVNIPDSFQSSDYYYCYVHLCLELWFNSIKVLVAVNSVPLNEGTLEAFCSDLNQLDTYMQVITLFIIDYLNITIRIYRNLNSLCNSPFICKCFADFWGILIQAFNTKLVDEKYSFWTIYRNAVQYIQKYINSENSTLDVPIDAFSLITETIKCSQISEPFLWLTSHVAPLYTFGNNTEEKTVSGYPVVKCLILPLLMNNTSGIEKSLRYALFYTWKILSLWEPSPEVLLTLTDSYIKKIDETYSLNENRLEDLPCLFNDSVSWFKYIDNLSNTSVTIRNETSFYIYLRILYKQLTMDSNEGNLWRSLKGRVYSKFMPKKLIELSDVGLQNSFSLILTVAASGQVEAVDKISSLVSIFKTSSIKKQLISWKALFVLMLIYQKKGLNLKKIIAKAVDFFNLKCSEYSSSEDNLNKLNLINLLLVYINGMKELFKQCSSLKLSECELVASGFSSLLPSCGVPEKNSILHILFEIFQKVQNITTDIDGPNDSLILTEYLKFLELSFKYIFPYLKEISPDDTVPLVVSDIAAIFTILSCKFALSLTKKEQDFSSIFMHFAFNNSVNSSVMCHYLYLVLENESLHTMLKKTVPNFTSLIFQSWLKLIIDPPTFPSSCEEVHDLSYKVISLSEIAEIFPKVRDLDFRSNPSDTAIKIFEIMGKTFEELSDWADKFQLKPKACYYFQNFASHASTRVKNHSDKTLALVYKLISHLVYHCSLIIHKKYNRDGILQQLFDQVILVNKVFTTNMQAQSVLSHAINEFLPGILKGILKLDYRTDELALSNIKNLMSNHIFIHPCTNSSIKKLLITTVFNRAGSLKWDEFEFLLDIIAEHIRIYSEKGGSGKGGSEKGSFENPANGFELMFELFEVAPLGKKAFITNILFKNVLHIYMKETKLNEYLWNLICKISVYFKKCVGINTSKEILKPILEWFIQEKIQSCQQSSYQKGFKVLDCVSDYLPEIVSDVVSFLTKTIDKMEKDRGSGEDVVLRNQLKNTITKLQRKLSIQLGMNKTTFV